MAGWFNSQQYPNRTPLAPVSVQHLAQDWEPSIQEMVGERGGYTIAALEGAVNNKWSWKFHISKVWRAKDAISDKGIHSYLQHHYIIMQITPADSPPGRSAPGTSGSDKLAENGDASRIAEKDITGVFAQAPNKESGAIAVHKSEEMEEDSLENRSLKRKLPQAAETLDSEAKKAQQSDAELVDISDADIKAAGDAAAVQILDAWFETSEDNHQEDTQEADQEPDPSLLPQQAPAETGNSKNATLHGAEDTTQCGTSGENNRDSIQQEPLDVTLTTTTSLSKEQEEKLKPLRDAGMQLADAGQTWYLRIDRFNEADKWFACGSFENALSSEEAREKHYAPSSELTFEADAGRPCLYLDCIVPLLTRLGQIKYSVFAKANHCQWHAKVVPRIINTQLHFLYPDGLSEQDKNQVSAILLSGKAQQRFRAASKAKQPIAESAFAADFPEAPFLEECIQDLKAFAKLRSDIIPADCLGRPFPDMDFIIRSHIPLD